MGFVYIVQTIRSVSVFVCLCGCVCVFGVLPELKCERLVDPFSVSLSRGRLRESPISGLGHVSIPASGGSAAIFSMWIDGFW